MSDWFEEWFGEEYLALYPHRDEVEARRVVSFIDARVRLGEDDCVLDLACGAGRHHRALSSRWWTVGLDLSLALLRVARHAEWDAPLVRGDMRQLPFAAASFGLVVNLFTSFGYFRDDAQHQRVIREVARVTRPGGWFVLDFLNPPYVLKTLVEQDVRIVAGREVEQERVISADGRFVTKTITLPDEGRTFTERVRLFTPAELQTMMRDAGFAIDACAGGYDGRPITDESPRAIFFGRRA